VPIVSEVPCFLQTVTLLTVVRERKEALTAALRVVAEVYQRVDDSRDQAASSVISTSV
jgi:hypothetical protein